MLKPLTSRDPPRAGPYQLLGVLGEGGFGRVFLGQSADGLLAAVKLINTDLAGDHEFRVRFRREAAAARRVSSRFTARFIDGDVDGPKPWLATEYVKGLSLADAVALHGPLPASSVLVLAAGLAEALAAIHAADLVHRDLNPRNVMLADDGPRVIDFGIARAAGETRLTSTGKVIGTVAYMSPEQALGRTVGPPSDVFSLGSVLMFAATGQGPFGTGPDAETLFRVAYATPDLDHVPVELRPLAERCLTKDPDRRPSAGDLVAYLGDAHPLKDWLSESAISTITGTAPRPVHEFTGPPRLPPAPLTSPIGRPPTSAEPKRPPQSWPYPLRPRRPVRASMTGAGGFSRAVNRPWLSGRVIRCLAAILGLVLVGAAILALQSELSVLVGGHSASSATSAKQANTLPASASTNFAVHSTFSAASRTVSQTVEDDVQSVPFKISLTSSMRDFELILQVDATYNPVQLSESFESPSAVEYVSQNCLDIGTREDGGSIFNEYPLDIQLHSSGDSVTGRMLYAAVLPGEYFFDLGCQYGPYVTSNFYLGSVISSNVGVLPGITGPGAGDNGMVVYAERTSHTDTVFFYGVIGDIGDLSTKEAAASTSCISGASQGGRYWQPSRSRVVQRVNGAPDTGDAQQGFEMGSLTFSLSASQVSGKQFYFECPQIVQDGETGISLP